MIQTFGPGFSPPWFCVLSRVDGRRMEICGAMTTTAFSAVSKITANEAGMTYRGRLIVLRSRLPDDDV